ncbi:MAG: hypothetical protein ABUL47_00370, partial [Leifsonia sp.]
MTIWIFVETGIIAGISWLQVLYFATGTIQLVLVLALLGVVRWLPREPLRPGKPSPSLRTPQPAPARDRRSSE